MPRTPIRYVAIGDSFTEGVGDELADGQVRGWSDLTAQGWANSLGEPVQYANLAIRGKLVWPIVEQQLEQALALKPTHLSFNGGGNDMLRPRTPIARVADAFTQVLQRCEAEGVTLILLSGANPTQHLPFGTLINRRGNVLSEAVVERITGHPEVVRALNWHDTELGSSWYWSEDRLHMNARGHHRVAARVLESLGQSVDEGWWHWEGPVAKRELRSTDYYRTHVGPWLKRRLTGTSSGDGRLPKYADWHEITPSVTDGDPV